MTWNEIQAKWADMTRRVRSDLPHDDGDTLAPVAHQSASQRSSSNMHVPSQQDRSDA